MSTIKDVAREAGVSVATVSRIMNNRGAISEKTRKKVHKVMKELNYHPNEMARALQTKRSHIIGLVVPLIDYSFFSRLTDAVEEACYDRGYKLLLCKSNRQQERELEMLDMLQANKVAGILLCSRMGDAGIYADYELPLVSIDREIKGIPSVTADNHSGGTQAAQALINAGCRHPLLFGIDVPDYMMMSLRYRGFRDACAGEGLDCSELLVTMDDMKETDEADADGTLLADKLVKYLQKHPHIDGIFITGDMLAAKLICAEQMAGSVFSELPIVGYDGLEVAGLLKLTTIAQPIAAMGECAVDLLIRKIDGKPVPERSILPVELVERNSTLKGC